MGNALKGMKLCYKDRDSSRAWTSSIKVDFDKPKHLSDTSIKQRKMERERLIKEEKEKEFAENKRRNIEEMQKRRERKRKRKWQKHSLRLREEWPGRKREKISV